MRLRPVHLLSALLVPALIAGCAFDGQDDDLGDNVQERSAAASRAEKAIADDSADKSDARDATDKSDKGDRPSKEPQRVNLEKLLSGKGIEDQLEKGTQRVASDATSLGYVRGVILVQFENGIAKQLRARAAQGNGKAKAKALPRQLQDLLDAYGVTGYEPLFTLDQSSPQHFKSLGTRYKQRAARGDGGEVARLDNVFKVYVADQADIEAAVADLAEASGVVFAQPDRVVKTTFVPNDTFYGSQWGTTNATTETAWDFFTSNPTITIAVVDTGVDLTHPDLSANLWVNTLETVNGIDDDGNGYIDDINGWDFGANDPNPNDLCGHGTHVAGIAAATTNNGRGVAGVAFDARIMSLKGLGFGCGGNVSDLVAAMLYAVNNGADIINNSWGGSGYDALVESTINTATASGVVVVSAAGNSNAEAHDYFPANVERSITVSATTNANVRASYSNFGVKIDVGAPGGDGTGGAGDILSTVPATSYISNAFVTDNLGERYMWMAGTSMAAPHVAGLAALVLDAHPTWTVGQVTAIMRKTGLDISTPSFDLDGGHGLIQSQSAVTTTYSGNPPPTAQITDPPNNETIRGPAVAVLGDANTSTPGALRRLAMGVSNLPTSWNVFSMSFGQVAAGSLATLNTLNYADDTYTLGMRVRDNNATTSDERNLVHVDNVWIETPADNTVVSGFVTITGGASGNLGFQNYTLEWAPGCNATTGFTTFFTSLTQAPGLTTLDPAWNTNPIPSGQVTLRLTANFTAHTSTDEKCVVIDPYIAAGFPAAIQHTPAFKSPQLADLDNDGIQEIVVGASVYQANGTVRAGWTSFPGVGRANSAVADIDSDGLLEIIAADYDYAYVPPTYGAPVINAYTENKTLVWSHVAANPWYSNLYSQGTPGTISVGDVDGDGQDEVVFPIFFSYQPGPSPYFTHVHVLDAATGNVEAVHALPGYGVNSVALADLDQDGAVDMVTETWDGAAGNGVVYAIDSTGNALPGWPQNVSPGNSQGFSRMDPVIADVDRDGRLDVHVGKYLFNADGTLHTGWPTGYFSRITGALGQMDGDRAHEVVLGGGNHVVMWGTEHDATFRYLTIRLFENWFIMMFGENGAPGNPLIADIDGDGDVDAIHNAEYGHSYGTLLPIYGIDDPWWGGMVTDFPRWVPNNNPNGWTDPVRSTPAVGDIDGDGQVDMVVVVAGALYRWNLPAAVTAQTTSVWPMFQHDLRNTGTLLSDVAKTIAVDFRTGDLWDVDLNTGAVSNQLPTAAQFALGLATLPGLPVYTLVSDGGSSGTKFMEIDPITGATTWIATWPNGIGEGDIAFDPTSGILYGITSAGQFGTIDPITGIPSLITVIPGLLDPSAMAFDDQGQLWLVDGWTPGNVHEIDPVTGAILSTIPITGTAITPHKIGGMRFDSASGLLQAVLSIGSVPPAKLWEIDPLTGFASIVGATTPANYLSGLVEVCQ